MIFLDDDNGKKPVVKCLLCGNLQPEKEMVAIDNSGMKVCRKCCEDVRPANKYVANTNYVFTMKMGNSFKAMFLEYLSNDVIMVKRGQGKFHINLENVEDSQRKI